MDNELAVPEDFPALAQASSLAGVQPKVPAVEHEGRYYAPGDTPPERYERWQECEELAQLFVTKCTRNEHGKYAHLSRPKILEQYLRRMLKARLASELELRWVIRRTAAVLGWPAPASATVT